MQYGVPVYQKSWSRLYDPLRGRSVLGEHKGPFKTIARFMYNKPVKARHDGHTVLAEFIDRYEGIEKRDISYITQKGKNYIGIGKGPFDLFRCTKYGQNAYFIKPNNAFYKGNLIPLKIYARDIDTLKEKLVSIFNKPIARSKLELRTQKIPFLHTHNFEPGHGRYVLLNDGKMVANRYPQPFETSNSYTIADEFDTELGSVSAEQINHHMSDDERGKYSTKRHDKAYITVQDDAWVRMHSLTEHLLSSNISKEIINNVINMHHKKGDRSHYKNDFLTQELLQDYVYNIHGKGTANTRKRGESPTLQTYDLKDKHILNQFLFGANPFRGGRFFRDLPYSLEQTILAFYAPQVDGTRVCKYDIDPEKFKAEMDKMVIRPSDRQLMAAHSRKLLSAYVTLKLLQDELANINLDTKDVSEKQYVYNKEKWRALNQIQDKIFASTGDQRDFLRKAVASFGQVKNSVKTEMPKFIPNDKSEYIKEASKSEQGFKNYTVSNLFEHITSYTYLENLLGWHARERIGSMIYSQLIDKPYSKPVPKVRASTGAIILLEGMELLSRELKFIDNALEKVTNGKGTFVSFINKLKNGDIKGVQEYAQWTKDRLMLGVKADTLYPNFKKQTLQAEGILLEEDFFPPETRKYFGENQGFFFGNAPTNRVGFQYGKKLGKIFADYMQLCGYAMKRIQAEMKRKHLTDIYQTTEMVNFDKILRTTGKGLTQEYIKSRLHLFKALNQEQLNNITFELDKKFYHYLQVCTNVSALLANAPDVVYDYK